MKCAHQNISSSTRAHVKAMTTNNLQASVQLLQWQKLANESDLKASILKNKLKANTESMMYVKGGLDHGLNEAIQEEMSKELRLAQSGKRASLEGL